MTFEINLNPVKQPKCKHCGRAKGIHKAKTLNCPFNEVRKGYFNFKENQFYEPKEIKKKK